MQLTEQQTQCTYVHVHVCTYIGHDMAISLPIVHLKIKNGSTDIRNTYVCLSIRYVLCNRMVLCGIWNYQHLQCSQERSKIARGKAECYFLSWMHCECYNINTALKCNYVRNTAFAKQVKKLAVELSVCIYMYVHMYVE